MKKLGKIGLILFCVLSGLYILLFIVFFFDLDGKALFYGVEPFLKNHYDKMERKDPLKSPYSMDVPKYEYDGE